MTEITAFDAYRREWHLRGNDLFFATMRSHPQVFRGRFPLLYDATPFADRTFTIQERT